MQHPARTELTQNIVEPRCYRFQFAMTGRFGICAAIEKTGDQLATFAKQNARLDWSCIAQQVSQALRFIPKFRAQAKTARRKPQSKRPGRPQQQGEPEALHFYLKSL